MTNQFNNAPIDKGMIVRKVVLFLALLNLFLVLTGFSPLPFGGEQMEFAATAALSAVAPLWAWWKDNDVSRKARRRTEYNKDKGLK
jgi:SPP1 family holin